MGFLYFCHQALDALKEVASINQEEEKQEPENRSRIFEVLCISSLLICWYFSDIVQALLLYQMWWLSLNHHFNIYNIIKNNKKLDWLPQVINQGMASFKSKMYISVNYVEGEKKMWQ